jgi:hypothetical protein
LGWGRATSVPSSLSVTAVHVTAWPQGKLASSGSSPSPAYRYVLIAACSCVDAVVWLLARGRLLRSAGARVRAGAGQRPDRAGCLSALEREKLAAACTAAS